MMRCSHDNDDNDDKGVDIDEDYGDLSQVEELINMVAEHDDG